MFCVVALSACTFSKTLSENGDDMSMGDDGNGNEMPMPNVAPCKTKDGSGLVVCLEFEDSVADALLDDSSPARMSVEATGVTQIPRDGTASSMALDVGSDAKTYVTQSPTIDLASGYTLAAWVKPDTLPAGGTARGVMDHEGQYAMIVSATQNNVINNRCQHTGVSKYEFTEQLPVGTWSFLACTWDGNQLCAWRWSSPTDHQRWCHVPMYKPAASGTNGLSIGHLSNGAEPIMRFDGALDSVQVYARAMSENQLCDLAGQGAGCLPCSNLACL